MKAGAEQGGAKEVATGETRKEKKKKSKNGHVAFVLLDVEDQSKNIQNIVYDRTIRDQPRW